MRRSAAKRRKHNKSDNRTTASNRNDDDFNTGGDIEIPNDNNSSFSSPVVVDDNNDMDEYDDDDLKRRGSVYKVKSVCSYLRRTSAKFLLSSLPRRRWIKSSKKTAPPHFQYSVRAAATVILLLAFFLLWIWTDDVLGKWADQLNLYLFGRFVDSKKSSTLLKKAAKAAAVVQKWPSVELRNRKTIHEYKNAYLEAILTRNNISNDHYFPNKTNNNANNLVSPIWSNHKNAVQTEMVVGSDSSQQQEEEKSIKTNEWEISSFTKRLTQGGCRPGWLCHRCLFFPLAGSLQKCRTFCPTCYEQILMNEANVAWPSISPLWETSSVNDKEENRDHFAGRKSTSRRIPRTIHHVGRFKEESLPTLFSSPEWIRGQNAWRSQSQYQYHMYPTIDYQRQWVERYYPALVVAAFDWLEGDDRQLDLFALLVLFRSGGIVAHMDILLETQLETLLSEEHLSFVATVDTRSPSQSSTVYPGLMAAQAGHPIIGRAIETLVSTVASENHEVHASTLYRSQNEERMALIGRFFDVQTFEFWRMQGKTRFSPLSFAIHSSLLHSSTFQPLETGVVMYNNSNIKNADNDFALFLLLSEHDTGATRISDIERNLLVATMRR